MASDASDSARTIGTVMAPVTCGDNSEPTASMTTGSSAAVRLAASDGSVASSRRTGTNVDSGGRSIRGMNRV